MRPFSPRAQLRLSCVLLLPLLACDPAGGSAEGTPLRAPSPAGERERTADPEEDAPAIPAEPNDDWLKASTISLRNRVSVPAAAAKLGASEIIAQLKRYDPGSLMRCEVQDDPAYRAVVDALGGVTWGYAVSLLEDKSQPEFRLGPPPPIRQDFAPTSGSANAGGGAPVPVEIEEADIVGMSESAALFYSTSHGLLLVDLVAKEPRFKCAVKLPGSVKNFFYYRDHLVAMMGSSLLHFKVDGGGLKFVESIKLEGDVLDTRRFNDKLVVYTRFELEPAAAPVYPAGTPINGGAFAAPIATPVARRSQHRSLQVFKFGDTLREELNESLINTTMDDAYLRSGAVDQATPIGSVVHSASSYGDVLYASDRYFVVSEMLDVTKLSAWVTQTYRVCTKSHVVKTVYNRCSTRYETRPNPDYVPPDNSGGDRACKGMTLADCLLAVSRASNPTIQVPVGVDCHEASYDRWYCDAYESRSHSYPQFSVDSATRLTIFEYTPEAFVRLDGKVREITTPALADVQSNASVEKLTTSSSTFDLSIPGRLQTLYFQSGFLYAIASGMLQVYSMGNSSLVRTSSLRVANDTLQSSLFSPSKLYLSDFGYSGGKDHSTLRVIDLTNPGFPKQVSQDRQLPGGHSSILATSSGILTIGAVQNFQPDIRNVLKLGLFADPVTTESAYLILGTDLSAAYLDDAKAHYFDGSANRLFLPYTGPERSGGEQRARIGVSQLLSDEIVSEGALAMAEPVQRVRARPAAPGQFLSFAPNSVSWLTMAADQKWSTSPLLAYYTPIALYRQNDRDDYVEISRLSTRCQLRWVNAASLNARTAPDEANAFDCGTGYPTAYGRNLLFGATHGVQFDADGKVKVLEQAEVADLNAKLRERQVCLFSETPTSAPIDFAKLPPADMLKCYSPAEYQALLSKLR